MQQSVITWGGGGKKGEREKEKKSQVMKLCFKSTLWIKRNLTPSCQQPLQHYPTNTHTSALESWAILTLSTNRVKKKMTWGRLGHSLMPLYSHHRSKKAPRKPVGRGPALPESQRDAPAALHLGRVRDRDQQGAGIWGWKSKSRGIIRKSPMGDVPVHMLYPSISERDGVSGSYLWKTELP